MGDTTLLLGSGINRSVIGPEGPRSPLARDFFRQALRLPRLSTEDTQVQMSPLLGFVHKYWRLDRCQLLTADFDLEECYTFAELQRREAHIRGDASGLAQASRILHLLTGLILDYLTECEHWHHHAPEFLEFAQWIYSTRSGVLTFNYDNLLETAIERSSPRRKPNLKALEARVKQELSPDETHDDEVGFSFHEWNAFVAYKVRFDEVTLRTPGIPRTVPGARYYEHPQNMAEHAPFLKLHGSLGWFEYSGYGFDGVPVSGRSATKMGKTVLRRPSPRFPRHEIDYNVGEILLPLIITPILNKPYAEHHVFQEIWAEARSQLEGCRSLVIGGYSFPPTDFHVRRLLREAFCERSVDSLCIINPDTSVVQTAKDLCNFKGPVLLCSDLAEFLKKAVRR